MRAPGASASVAVLAAAPPPRPAAAGAAAAPYLQAMEGVRRLGTPRLSLSSYEAVGCMDLALAFEEAIVVGRPEPAGAPLVGSQQYAPWLLGVIRAVAQQHGDWLDGVVRSPTRRELGGVARLHWAVHDSPAAHERLVQTAQLQSLTVQVDGDEWRIPASTALGSLMADQHQLVVTGLEARCCRQGLTAALLVAAGYTAGLGVSVVHESAGRMPGLPGMPLDVAALDRVVAVVQVPAAHAGLPRLPRRVSDSGSELQIEVRRRVVPRGQLVVRRVAAPPPPPPPPHAQEEPEAFPGVRPEMGRVFASAGITPEVRATSGPLLAEAAARAAVPPRVRAGLGFVLASAAPTGSAAAEAAAAAQRDGPGAAAAPTAVVGGQRPAAGGRAPAPAAPQPSGDADMGEAADDPGAGAEGEGEDAAPGADALMLPALPQRTPPLDEPGFGAACQHVQDETDATLRQTQYIVMQAKAVEPAAYAQAREVSRPSELPYVFRVALHAQARAVLGDEVAAPLAVDPGEGREAWPEGADAAATAGPAPPAALRAAPAGAAQPAARAGSPTGPSSPAGDDRAGIVSPTAGGLHAAARLRQRDPPSSSNDKGSWLALQAASLGQQPGTGGSASASGRGRSRGRGKQ